MLELRKECWQALSPMANPVDLKKRILGIISRHGRATVPEIAKRLGTRPHVIRRRLQELMASGSLTQSILIDPRPLGYSIYNFYFDLAAGHVSAVLTFLQKQQEVAWVMENSGLRRYEATLVVKDYWELNRIFDNLGTVTNFHIERPLLSMPGNVYHWGMRFLDNSKDEAPPMALDRPEDRYEADDLDLSILHALRESGDGSLSSVARRLLVPNSTVSYRYERLHRAGVITAPAYFLVRDVPDLIHAQILVLMKSRASRSRARLMAFCSENVYVEELIECVGQWDYKLTVYSDSVEGLLKVEDLLRDELGGSIAEVYTFIRRRVLKSSLGMRKHQ